MPCMLRWPTACCPTHAALPSYLQGFMSEGVDRFATDVVYPAFGPTIGVFLLMSSAYGLWKTYGPGLGSSGKQQ